MTEQDYPDPDHYKAVDEVTNDLRQRYDLEVSVDFDGAIERVNNAKDAHERIASSVDQRDVDGTVASFVHDSVQSDSNALEGVAVGIEEIYEHPDSFHTALELDESPVEDVSLALGDRTLTDGDDEVERLVELIEAAKDHETDEKELSSEIISEDEEDVLNYLNGFVNVKELVDYIDELPDLHPNIQQRIFELISRSYNKAGLTSLMLRFPELSGDKNSETFNHFDEITTLVYRRPDMLEKMTNMRLVRGVESLNAIDLYDDEPDADRRARMIHHVDIILDDEATAVAKRVSMSILRLATVHDIGEIGYGAVAHGATTSYRPDQNKLGKLEIPLSSRLPKFSASESDLPKKSLEDMTEDEKVMCLKHEYVDAHRSEEGSIDIATASLADLKGAFQELFLAELVEASYEKSHSEDRKAASTRRNVALARSGIIKLDDGDLVHTTYTKHLEAILSNGIVCGELIGENADADAFPHNVDFYQVDESVSREENVMQAISSRIKSEWVDESEQALTIVIKDSPTFRAEYPRRIADIDSDESNRHNVILGAVASIEMCGIITHDADRSLNGLVRRIVENRMYIPILDELGKVVFTPEQYDEMLKIVSQKDTAQSSSVESEVAYEYPRDLVPPWKRPLVQSPMM